MVWWPAVVFGWPAVIAALAAYAAAIIMNRPWPAFLGAVIATPFCLYVSATPRFGGLGLVVLGLNFLSVWASRRHQPIIAAVLLVPFVALAGTIARAVLTQ